MTVVHFIDILFTSCLPLLANSLSVELVFVLLTFLLPTAP